MALDLGLDKLQPQLEKLARLPKPARMALIPGVAVIVIALYTWLLFLPVQQELAGVNDQNLQLQRKLSEVRSVAANEAAVKEEIAVLEKKLAAALRQLPDQKELPVLLTDVTSLGKNAGLDFKSFKPKDEVRRAFYAEVPIELEFTGRFHDIAMFFDEVSRLPRIVNIGELDMTISRETPTETYLAVKGKATTFRFVEGEPDADKKAAAPAKGPRARAAVRGGGE